MDQRTEIRIDQCHMGGGYNVWVVEGRSDKRSVAAPLAMVPVEPGAAVPPTLRLCQDGAQLLMDELWRAGVRPRDGAGALAHVDALAEHIKDLRRVAFTMLDRPAKVAP